ncbi:circumsporozoite protein-like [Drosophila bipectinata]|uniref:circumsporozoite protein-like n=1 Tax=Drosophila bipectinata TaxID=42026 RepID=UPI0038B37ED5
MAKIMDENEVASALSSDLPYSTAPSGVGQGDAAQTGGAIVGVLVGGRNGSDAGGALKENSADEGLKVGDAGERAKGGDAGGNLKENCAEEGMKVGDAGGSLQKGDSGEGSKAVNAGLDLKRDNAGEGLKGGNAEGLQKGDAAESLQVGDAVIGLGNVGEGPKGTVGGPKEGDAGEGNAGGDVVNDRAVGEANDAIQATGEGINEVEAPETSHGDAGVGNVNQSIEEIIYESDDDGVWEGSYSGSTTSINRGQRTTGIRFGDCNSNHPARERNAPRNYDQVTVNDGSGDENATHERRPYSRYPDYPDSSNNSDDEMSEYLYEYEENVVRRPHNPREEQAAVGRVGRIRGRRRSRAVTDASPNVNKNKKRFGIRL